MQTVRTSVGASNTAGSQEGLTAAKNPLQALWETAMAGKGQSSLSYSGFSWEHPAKDLVPSWGRLQGTEESLPRFYLEREMWGAGVTCSNTMVSA